MIETHYMVSDTLYLVCETHYMVNETRNFVSEMHYMGNETQYLVSGLMVVSRMPFSLSHLRSLLLIFGRFFKARSLVVKLCSSHS